MTDPYAPESETNALIQPDTRTPAERELARLLTEAGEGEQGFEAEAALRRIAVGLIERLQVATGREPVWWISSLDDPQPHCVKDLKYCSAAVVEKGDHLKYIPVQRMQATQPAAQPAAPEAPQGIGGALVAIKTLLSRDPCAHANTAIAMVDEALKLAGKTPAQPSTHQCHWVQTDDEHSPNTYQGTCGAMWTFTDGGPRDNGQAYCPQCGGVCVDVRADQKGVQP